MLFFETGLRFKFFSWSATIIILLISFSCATDGIGKESRDSPEQQESLELQALIDAPNWLWDSRPSRDSLVFVASGPRYSDREREKFAALKEAALQAGVFSGFWGSSQDYILSSESGTNFEERTRAYYDGETEDAALKAMKAEDIWVTEEGTWVKFRFKNPGIPPLDWQPEILNGKPSWIISPPTISGWVVAIGLGGHQSTLAKMIRKADEAALSEIILQLHGENSTLTIEKSQSSATWSQSSSASASYGKAFGRVRGFLVIARWYDKSGTWSLAVCPQDWNGER